MILIGTCKIVMDSMAPVNSMHSKVPLDKYIVKLSLEHCALCLTLFCCSVGSRDGPGQAVILQPGHPVWAPHDLSPVPGTGPPVCVHGRHHPCHPQNGGCHVSHTDMYYLVRSGIDSSSMVDVSNLKITLQLILY